MNTWILLLRGVMPTGKNKVAMADLRQALTKAGFARVRTWIQSGNVLVDTDLSREDTREQVRQVLLSALQEDLAVMVTNRDEILAVLDQNPFLDLAPDRVFYGFFNDAPQQDRARALLLEDFGEDRLALRDQAVYMFIPGSAARSRLNNAFLQRRLGIDLTFRNRNTLTKLCAMAAEP